MFRYGSSVLIVPIAMAFASLTGCARGDAAGPGGATADFAVSPDAPSPDAAVLQEHHTAGPRHAEALAAHLDLSPIDEERIRALLDSLRTEMMLAAQDGPDAYRTAAQGTHARLEAALPADARPVFRQMHEGMPHGEMREHSDSSHVHPGAGHHPPHDATHDATPGGGLAGHHGMHQQMPEGGHATGRHGGG